MTTEERLAKVERELGRAKRRSRWLLAALALGLGVLALVWASAASVPKAEAQGAVASGPCRYQLAVAPGYYMGGGPTGPGGSMWSETQLYMLDQITGGLFRLAKTGTGWEIVFPTARFVEPAQSQLRICPNCKGTGRVITQSGEARCKSCNGTGKIAP